MPHFSYPIIRTLFASSRDKYEGKPMDMLNTRIKVSRRSPTTYRDWKSPDTVFALTYFGTEVVRWYPDGLASVSFNGWDTITTRRRIREHTPGIGIGRQQGFVYAWQNGRVWPGTDTTWFYSKRGELCFEDGTAIPDSLRTRAPRPLPKSRKPLNSPKLGDAFRDPQGRAWLCVVETPTTNRLVPYAGDHPDDPRYVVLAAGASLGLTQLELLVMAAPGWEAISRFTWSRVSNINNQENT